MSWIKKGYNRSYWKFRKIIKIITEGKVEREVEITKVQDKEIPIIIYCQICGAKILDKIGFH